MLLFMAVEWDCNGLRCQQVTKSSQFTEPACLQQMSAQPFEGFNSASSITIACEDEKTLTQTLSKCRNTEAIYFLHAVVSHSVTVSCLQMSTDDP